MVDSWYFLLEKKAEKSYIFYRLGNKFSSATDKEKMTDDLLRLMQILKVRQHTTYNKTLWQKIGKLHIPVCSLEIL